MGEGLDHTLNTCNIQSTDLYDVKSACNITDNAKQDEVINHVTLGALGRVLLIMFPYTCINKLMLYHPKTRRRVS